MQNLGESGTVLLFNILFKKNNVYKMCTYRISVSHEICKTKGEQGGEQCRERVRHPQPQQLRG